jgi:hypothetical protein
VATSGQGMPELVEDSRQGEGSKQAAVAMQVQAAHLAEGQPQVLSLCSV